MVLQTFFFQDWLCKRSPCEVKPGHGFGLCVPRYRCGLHWPSTRTPLEMRTVPCGDRQVKGMPRQLAAGSLLERRGTYLAYPGCTAVWLAGFGCRLENGRPVKNAIGRLSVLVRTDTAGDRPNQK